MDLTVKSVFFLFSYLDIKLNPPDISTHIGKMVYQITVRTHWLNLDSLPTIEYSLFPSNTVLDLRGFEDTTKTN